MLSVLSAAVTAALFLYFVRTYANAVRSKPKVVVLSDLDDLEDNLHDSEKPCAQYDRKCSEHIVKQGNGNKVVVVIVLTRQYGSSSNS